MKKDFDFRKLLVLGTLLLVIFIPKSPQPSSTGKTVSLQDFIDAGDEAYKEDVFKSWAHNSSPFRRHFGEGRYFKHFDALEKELNEQFNKQITEESKERNRIPLQYVTEHEYYKDSLELLEQKKLTKEEIFKYPGQHIFNFRVHLIRYDLLKSNEDIDTNRPPYVNVLQEKINKYIETNGYRVQSGSVICDYYNSRLKLFNSQKFKGNIVEFFMGRAIFPYYNFIDRYGDGASSEIGVELNALKRKYNEEFKWAGSMRDYQTSETEPNGRIISLYAPVNRPDIKFTVGGDRDKYLTVLAQKAMYEEIDKIINEEGYGGKIAHLTTPLSHLAEFTDMDTVSYDMKKSFNNKTFIENEYEGSYDNVLNVLLGEKEEIDYHKLQRIVARVNGLSKPKKDKSNDEFTRSVTMIYFYRVTDYDKKVILDLFKKQWCSETFFREARTLSNLGENFEIERAETDGFYYLDVFPIKKETYYYLIPSNEEDILNLSIEQFKNVTKVMKETNNE